MEKIEHCSSADKLVNRVIASARAPRIEITNTLYVSRRQDLPRRIQSCGDSKRFQDPVAS